MSAEVPSAGCLCLGPAGVQAKLRPGVWVPGIRSPHLYEEAWRVAANPVVCARDVLRALDKLQAHGAALALSFAEEGAERSRLELLAFSRLRHTSVVRVTFDNRDGEGCTGTARAFSSGLFPSWFPLNFLFSCLLFFVPFHDSGRNQRWLAKLREQMTVPIEIVKQGRKC